MTQSYLKLRVDKCLERDKVSSNCCTKDTEVIFCNYGLRDWGSWSLQWNSNESTYLEKFQLRNKFAAFRIWELNTHLGFNLTDSHCWAWSNTWPGSFWKSLATLKAKLSFVKGAGAVLVPSELVQLPLNLRIQPILVKMWTHNQRPRKSPGAHVC